MLSVEGFDKLFNTMQQQVILKGQSQSTFGNYIRRIALISLHFRRLPDLVADEERCDSLQISFNPQAAPSADGMAIV